MRTTAEILLFGDLEEYRAEFKRVFVDDKNHKFRGVPIEFVEADFNHVFFEPNGSGERVFSKRRAKRMLFIKSILTGEVQVELMFENESGNFAIFCEDLESVMYLRVRVGQTKLQIGTFFDFGKDHGKMCKKQKNKCEAITDAQFLEKIEKAGV